LIIDEYLKNIAMTENVLNFKNLIEKYADNPALIWPDGYLTYHQYFQYINHLSKRLIEKGVKSGNRIAVLSDIHYHFPILFFAILSIGGIVVPLNPKFPKIKINALLEEIDCKWLITVDSSFTVDTENKVMVLNNLTIIDSYLETETFEEITSLLLSREATIVFTSGSGGNPKGVLHTIENHYYSALGSNENIPLNSNDCWMVSLPFFHIAGIAILFRALISGAASLIPDGNQTLQDQINQAKVTHLSLVSTQLYRWLDEMNPPESETSLKAVLLGGSQIPPTLIQQALQIKLPVYTSYGSTEMSSQIATTSGEDLEINPRSSGKVLTYRELKIEDKGEILVKGKTLCKGYVSGKDLTPCIDSESWLHTGDLGYIDDNQNLIIKGRLDNMFISGGENIYPEEIEQLLQFHNHIIDVCVVDVKDDEFGARPVAFIKMDGNKRMDEAHLKKYLEDRITGFKIPDRFFTWPEEMEGLKLDRTYFRELAIEKMRNK
jgi:O-succinylbenzoic acid--CoA ligase